MASTITLCCYNRGSGHQILITQASSAGSWTYRTINDFQELAPTIWYYEYKDKWYFVYHTDYLRWYMAEVCTGG